MPTFSYKARGQRGDAIEGTLEAASPDMAAARLAEGGLTPVDIHLFVEQVGLGKNLDGLFKPQVEAVDLIQFSRQMYSMLRAGIPIFNAINGLTSTCSNQTMADTLKKVAQSLESGHPLSDSLGQHPKVFSVFYISLIRVGETSGHLDEIFRQLAFYLDRDKVTREKIKAALRYPVFVFTAIIIALVVISIFVIPAFSNLFASFGADLPLATRILVAISEFMVKYWPLLLVLVVGGCVGLRTWLDTRAGRYLWDQHKLQLPLVGHVMQQAAMARFSQLFSLSLNSGVPLIGSLSVVAHAVGNSFMEERILGMRENIEHGRTLSLTAADSKIFDPLVVQMFTIGEESGTIPDLLREIADYYNREVDYATDKLGAAIEPILTVVIAGLVLVMAMGVFLPMWNLASVALH